MSSLSRGTKAEIFSILPAGTVLPFAGATAPDGWAICNGTAISRTDYPELFLAIGETWGNGDGSTTFNLPDLEGRFLRGADNSSGIDPDAGSRVPLGNGNAEGVGSLQNDAMQRIEGQGYCNFYGNTSNRVGNMPNETYGAFGFSDAGRGAYEMSGATNGYGAAKTGITFDSSNSPGAKTSNNESRPSNCSVNYIIKL